MSTFLFLANISGYLISISDILSERFTKLIGIKMQLQRKMYEMKEKQTLKFTQKWSFKHRQSPFSCL